MPVKSIISSPSSGTKIKWSKKLYFSFLWLCMEWLWWYHGGASQLWFWANVAQNSFEESSKSFAWQRWELNVSFPSKGITKFGRARRIRLEKCNLCLSLVGTLKATLTMLCQELRCTQMHKGILASACLVFANLGNAEKDRFALASGPNRELVLQNCFSMSFWTSWSFNITWPARRWDEKINLDARDAEFMALGIWLLKR